MSADFMLLLVIALLFIICGGLSLLHALWHFEKYEAHYAAQDAIIGVLFITLALWITR